MTNSPESDFVQPPATTYIGNAPQRGVFYVWCSGAAPEYYCVGTGSTLKNGNHIVYMHDLYCGPRKKVVKVGMDACRFAQWKRAEVVPARVYKLLCDAVQSAILRSSTE